jgi:predicted RNA-binding Zn ribbon-like protein
MSGTYNLPAPGALEPVRQLLNTWLIPSATRLPEDRLPALIADAAAWRRDFPAWSPAAGDTAEVLTRLRDDLRAALRADEGPPTALNGWLERFPPLAQVDGVHVEAAVRHIAPPDAGIVGWVLAAVVDAVADGTWSRLKICPDCQWVFYDRTRSRTKIWCDMLSGGAGGRSCGTIAKVRRYRERQAS